MISHAITIFRTLLIVPLFALLAFGGGGWVALALFLGAGLLDMVDGRVARALNETSPFGAMLDLIGDRLLTLATVLGLIVGARSDMGIGYGALFGIVLIVRDLVVASLNEALPGKLEIRVSMLEKVKIAAAFLGLAFLIIARGFAGSSLHQAAEGPAERDAGWGMAMFAATAGQVGVISLAIASILTLITLVDYWRRALRAFRA